MLGHGEAAMEDTNALPDFSRLTLIFLTSLRSVLVSNAMDIL